jgi:hypothetical protein
MLAQVLASLAKHGPSLNHALYAAEPLALHLRVSLTLLLDLCPPTHPDAQHLRSAMQVPSLLALPVQKYKSTNSDAPRRPAPAVCDAGA